MIIADHYHWRVQSVISKGLAYLESISCVKFVERSKLDQATKGRPISYLCTKPVYVNQGSPCLNVISFLFECVSAYKQVFEDSAWRLVYTRVFGIDVVPSCSCPKALPAAISAYLLL